MPKPIENNDAQSSSQGGYTGLRANNVAFVAVIAISCCVFVTLVLFVAVEIYRRKEKNAERRIFRRASEIYKRQSTNNGVTQDKYSLPI